MDEGNSKWGINEVKWKNKPCSTKIWSRVVGGDEWGKVEVKSRLEGWVSEEGGNRGFKVDRNGKGERYWKKIRGWESGNKRKVVMCYDYDEMGIGSMSRELENG